MALIALLAMMSFSLEAAARGKFRIGSGARVIGNAVKTYGPNVLTRTHLIECLSEDSRIARIDEGLEVKRATLEKRQATLDALGRNINISEQTLNRRSQSAIDSHNAQVERFNALVGETKDYIADFNRDVASSNTASNNFNQQCGGKTYYEDDLLSARATLGITGE